MSISTLITVCLLYVDTSVCCMLTCLFVVCWHICLLYVDTSVCCMLMCQYTVCWHVCCCGYPVSVWNSQNHQLRYILRNQLGCQISVTYSLPNVNSACFNLVMYIWNIQITVCPEFDHRVCVCVCVIFDTISSI